MKVRNQSHEARQIRVRYSISDKNTGSLRKEPNQKWKQICLPKSSGVDAGLTFGAGVEFGRIQVGVFYDLGLVNIATNKDDGRIIKNRALKVSMGYRFGQRGGGVRDHG